MAYLSKWRQITAALSGNIYTQEPMAANDARLASIRQALQLADTVLAHYANGAEQEARLRNLEEIMKRSARFGFLLFSQPSSFRFDWTSSVGSGLVTFPALLQTTDEDGAALRSARLFLEKKVVAV
jgi:hypothetical protein